MMKNEELREVCSKSYTQDDVDRFKWFIERDYHYTFFIDELPSAYIARDHDTATIKYENGIPIGYYDSATNEYFIYNHLEFIIQAHETIHDESSYRIVGFKVEPIT